MATRRIALFRGINVGGRNAVSMKELKAILERLGCAGVRTYIQSGNVVFDEAEAGAASAESIAAAFRKETGIDAHVQALSADDLRRAAEANPFAGEEPGTMHLFFLDEPPKAPDLNAVRALAKDSERWQLAGPVFYLHAPDGIARSKLAAGVERKLGVSATARNGRTVRKLLELACL